MERGKIIKIQQQYFNFCFSLELQNTGYRFTCKLRTRIKLDTLQINSFSLIHYWVHRTHNLKLGSEPWETPEGRTEIWLPGTNASEWHINQNGDSTRNDWWVAKGQGWTQVKV